MEEAVQAAGLYRRDHKFCASLLTVSAAKLVQIDWGRSRKDEPVVYAGTKPWRLWARSTMFLAVVNAAEQDVLNPMDVMKEGPKMYFLMAEALATDVDVAVSLVSIALGEEWVLL